MKYLLFLFIVLVYMRNVSCEAVHEEYGKGNTTVHHAIRIHIANLHFEHVKEPLLISLVLLTAALFKLAFHKFHFLASVLPESCMLIVFGLVVGFLLHASNLTSREHGIIPAVLSPKLFFIFLLPPIVLEAAFSLHDRVFIDNFGTVLLYAVVGTLLNCFLIGPIMFGLTHTTSVPGLHAPLTITQSFLFASLIVAVDPVAVLAIFQEIGVNNVLYFLVFGESLLNDAVTVVLYKISQTFCAMQVIPPDQVLMGVIAFFSVSLGGMVIGVISGIVCAFVTRFTRDVRILEVLFVFTFAYVSYLVADMFELSGIIAMICCGLVQAEYVFHNISEKSRTTVEYFINMHAAISDAIIFMYLGLSLLEARSGWNAAFVAWSIIMCTLIRFCGVVLLTNIANKYRVHKIYWEEQFIMGYGGLRGAVAFSLVCILTPNDFLPADVIDLFKTTTLAVILFTVFIQGTTIKPLVKLFHIERAKQEDKTENTVFDVLNHHLVDHIMGGVEEILGLRGHNYIRQLFGHYNDRYMKPLLLYSPMTLEESIMEYYQRAAMQQHLIVISRAPNSPDELVATPLPVTTPEADIAHYLTGDDRTGKLSSSLAASLTMLDHNAEHLRGPAIIALSETQLDNLEPLLSEKAMSSVRGSQSLSVSGSSSYVSDADIHSPKEFSKLLIKRHTHTHRRGYHRKIVGSADADVLTRIRDKQRRTNRLLRMKTIYEGSMDSDVFGHLIPDEETDSLPPAPQQPTVRFRKTDGKIITANSGDKPKRKGPETGKLVPRQPRSPALSEGDAPAADSKPNADPDATADTAV